MSHSLASLFFLSREARKSILQGKIVNLARQDSQSWRPTLTVLRCKTVNLASFFLLFQPSGTSVLPHRMWQCVVSQCLAENSAESSVRRLLPLVCLQTILVRRKSSQLCCSVKFRRPLRPVFCAACVPYRAGAGGVAQCGYGTERKNPARLCRVVCQCDMPCCGRCVSQRISCCPLPRQRLSSCC